MFRQIAVISGTFIGMAAAATGAYAHAHLKKATPPVGGTVATSPTEIRLQFNESVEPRFSGITLIKDGDRAPISTGAAETDPKDHSTLIVKVQTSLSAGIYKVKWHAVSVDTHKTQGDFTFEVR